MGIEIPELSGEMGLCRVAETARVAARYSQRDRGDETFTKKKGKKNRETIKCKINTH